MGQPLFLKLSGIIHLPPYRLNLGGNAGYCLLYQLETGYRSGELVAFPGVFYTGIKTALSHTDTASSYKKPCRINTNQAILQTAAYAPNQIHFRHPAVTEGEIDHIAGPVANHVNSSTGKPRRPLINGDKSYAFCAAAFLCLHQN